MVWFNPNIPRHFKRMMSTTLGLRLVLDKYLGKYVDVPKNKNQIGKETIQKFGKKL